MTAKINVVLGNICPKQFQYNKNSSWGKRSLNAEDIISIELNCSAYRLVTDSKKQALLRANLNLFLDVAHSYILDNGQLNSEEHIQVRDLIERTLES